MADNKQRTVLIALDGSKHSEHALQWYLDMMRKPDDKVLLTFCAEHTGMYPPMAMIDANPSFAIDIAREQVEQMKLTHQKLNDTAKALNLEQSVKRLSGFPGEAIVNEASEQHADLIVCGSRGQGLIRRTLLGSVSDYLMHHSHVPVVVCKHEDEHHKLALSSPSTTGECAVYT